MLAYYPLEIFIYLQDTITQNFCQQLCALCLNVCFFASLHHVFAFLCQYPHLARTVKLQHIHKQFSHVSQLHPLWYVCYCFGCHHQQNKS